MHFGEMSARGKIIGTYVSKYEGDYSGSDYFFTKECSELFLDVSGIKRDRHYGSSTLSDSRVTNLFDKGTPIRNDRQWSAVSPAEIAFMSKKLSLEKALTPEELGINILIDGLGELYSLPGLTHLVISPYVDFKKSKQANTVLVVYGQALPCRIAGKGIGKNRHSQDLEKSFVSGAIDDEKKSYRGIVGYVKKGGIIQQGYNVWALRPTGQA
jgi:hypothetical protein